MKKDFYTELLNEWCGNETPLFLCAYRKVRDIPYGSIGERDPEVVVRKNLGSCSGKHLLLYRLFKQIGLECRLVTCLHYFNEAIPKRNDYPDKLKKIVTSYKIPDFHHYIKMKRKGKWLDVDATWDQVLADYGFPVNLEWNGEENTIIAVKPIRFFQETENIIDLKIRLINQLNPVERKIRAEFMALLTQWMAGIRKKINNKNSQF